MTCLVWHGVLINMPVKQKQPLRVKDTPNPKPRGRQRETTPAKLFPRHDIIEHHAKNLMHSRILHSERVTYDITLLQALI